MVQQNLSIRDLNVRFDGLRAVSDVDLEVLSGQRVGIIGPNGAGKSTLFNAVSGRVRVTTGRLTLNGEEFTYKRPDERAGLGIVQTFQNIQILPSLSILDNIIVGAHLRATYPAIFGFFGLPMVRTREAQLAREAKELLERLDLGAYATRKVFQLPYAIQKRVELARTLMASPKVLLLDEPATGMNDFEKTFLARTILDMQTSMGFTLIAIEHDVLFLSSVVETMIAMNFGQVIARGDPQAVIADPEVVRSYTG